MAEVICVQAVWNQHRLAIGSLIYRAGDVWRRAKFLPVYINPETEHPVGRKGLVLARAWETLGHRAKAAGMLVLDGDVAVDPVQVGAMLDCIDSDPGSVWTAPVRIWPISTHRRDWVWGHWDKEASQEMDATATWFSFNFTYLPGALIDRAIKNGMKDWVYPRVDSGMSQTAQKMGMAGRVVHCDPPVHLHFLPSRYLIFTIP